MFFGWGTIKTESSWKKDIVKWNGHLMIFRGGTIETETSGQKDIVKWNSKITRGAEVTQILVFKQSGCNFLEFVSAAPSEETFFRSFFFSFCSCFYLLVLYFSFVSLCPSSFLSSFGFVHCLNNKF